LLKKYKNNISLLLDCLKLSTVCLANMRPWVQTLIPQKYLIATLLYLYLGLTITRQTLKTSYCTKDPKAQWHDPSKDPLQ
jgi:hypothetical protein